ncbi:MAG: universal stress protein [Gallionellaceae bacterium]|nr:universal stress protein [Gallionellaceae bacterium]
MTTPNADRLPKFLRKAQTVRPKPRVLLALDGNSVTQTLLETALRCCVQLTDRLDILLVNSPATPIALLKGLLIRLEHSGIDYRLASTDGVMADEVNSYLRRFLGITIVVIDNLSSLTVNQGQPPRQMQDSGHQIISLAGLQPQHQAKGRRDNAFAGPLVKLMAG